ncbi:rhodanese-like domain-containing protein [Pelotalea chapellei]|uniref:Rhodanese-like domain-containing protein n=1 Tax=Pelotalea chapellei TaxID=44671 RepID=A0ABS5U889_9BACT|nr:rhodanese-like domain-containing protein [Pelotalea chapellei]MBT1071875.1 rhodanese-like domain-containing protein [Pelotalea chapellei]
MKKLRCFLVMFGLLLLGAVAVSAAEPYKNLTLQELKAMLDRREPLVIVDSRPSAEYREAHIIGAVSIPYNDMAANPALLHYPTSDKIVFYCNGFS